MTSINLVFRPSVKEGRHPGSLSLRLIHNRQVKTLTLSGCRIYESEWDRIGQWIVYPSDDPSRTAYLEEVEKRLLHETGVIRNLIADLEQQGRYGLDDILSRLSRTLDERHLSGFAEGLARTMEGRGQWRTARAYRTVTRGLVDFNKGRDIPLHHINACLVKDFEMHLKEKGRLPNTISYYMRNLRAIYNKAVAEKRIAPNRQDDPFAGVYTGVTKTMKRALSLEEIRLVQDINPDRLSQACGESQRRQEYARRLWEAHRYFNFCLYSRGMCFIDLAYLKKSNIRGGVIRYVRRKTGRQMEVRITEQMQAIIDGFAEATAGSPYVFPIITDPAKSALTQYESAMRVQNNRLKKLSSLAGLKKKITTHCARHSWATVGKTVNVATHVISECLGHASEKTTQIYLAQLENSLLDDANERITYAITHPRQQPVRIAAY